MLPAKLARAYLRILDEPGKCKESVFFLKSFVSIQILSQNNYALPYLFVISAHL
jgi:hypothetical protein